MLANLLKYIHAHILHNSMYKKHKIYIVDLNVFEKQSERYSDTGIFPTVGLFPTCLLLSEAGPNQSQSPRIPFGSPTWVGKSTVLHGNYQEPGLEADVGTKSQVLQYEMKIPQDGA